MRTYDISSSIFLTFYWVYGWGVFRGYGCGGKGRQGGDKESIVETKSCDPKGEH